MTVDEDEKREGVLSLVCGDGLPEGVSKESVGVAVKRDVLESRSLRGGVRFSSFMEMVSFSFVCGTYTALWLCVFYWVWFRWVT